MVPISREFVFDRAYVSNEKRLCFLTHHATTTDRNIANAQLYLFRNGKDWSQTVVKWAAVALTSVVEPASTLFVLGRDGDVLVGNASGYREESILERLPRRRGPLRNVRTIADVAYAVGMGRQVYRRLPHAPWERWEAGLPEQAEPLEVAGINAIDGTSAQDLYAVGWGGEIWHHDGAAWCVDPSPTELALFDVLAVSPTRIFACGQSGALLERRDGQWHAFDLPYPKPSFRSMAWFDDKLYLADGHALYRLEHGVLSVVDFGAGSVVPSAHLHAGDGILLSVAGKEVFMTKDARTWTPLPI